jgi:hypothetical protein
VNASATVSQIRDLLACRRRYAALLFDRATVTLHPDGTVGVVHADPSDQQAWSQAGAPVLRAVLSESAHAAKVPGGWPTASPTRLPDALFDPVARRGEHPTVLLSEENDPCT